MLLNIEAQDFDQSFLDSLPDDIKKDVLDKAKDQDEESDNNYRASQYSSALKEAEELNDLKERLERDLQELERRLQDDANLLKEQKELELFGSNFFNTYQTSFMPINEPNPDSSYTLDAGDIINIQLIGQIDFIESFIIGGDGSINIPDIGKLVLAGLNLDKASSLIESKVSSAFLGTDAYVSLDKLRDVNVLISGNVKNPGVYTLTGNSNILHALSIAGGINEFGSYREINLVRNNIIIESLDIYDLLIRGNYNLNKRLRSGDTVFVSARKNVITIAGAVKRPAKYELKDNENLDEIIYFSNGIKQTADKKNIYLERILDGTLKSIPIVNTLQFEKIIPIDGDMIYVREHEYRTASISGSVLKPGDYIMAAGETILDLINKAGGYTENAYPFGTVYENAKAFEINREANQILYEEFLDNIISISQQNISENFDLKPILSLVEEIRKSSPNGRIVIDLTDSESPNYVQDKDKIIIPEKNNNVYVYGEVSSEGAVRFSANKDIDYFVDKSGGYKKFADNQQIYILHPNGETERYSKKRNIFASQPNSDVQIYAGSIIFVPRKLDNSSTRRLATQAYVSILGNLGVALASLNSINNN